MCSRCLLLRRKPRPEKGKAGGARTGAQTPVPHIGHVLPSHFLLASGTKTLPPTYAISSPSAPAPGSPACSAGPGSCEGPSPSPVSPPGAGPSALHSPTPPGEGGVAGSWVCEPCPSSSLTRGNSTLHTLVQFRGHRRQPPAQGPGPQRSPAPQPVGRTATCSFSVALPLSREFSSTRRAFSFWASLS